MAAPKKDNVAEAAEMQSEQQKSDIKNAYIKAREKAFNDYPALLRSSIPEYTPGMNLKSAFDRLSFATGGQGNANPGVKRRSSLDKIAPDAPESIMPGRPVVSNAQQREKARAIGRKVSGETLKGTVISGSNAAFDSPEYAAAAQPGGLREQERDAELPAIQKAVFGSPQVGTAGSSDFKPASKDFQEATENSMDPVTEKPILGKSAKGTAQIGTAPSADFQAAVAGKGFYDTPYGRISARKGRVDDVSTPTDVQRTSLMEGLEGMGRKYNPDAKYGSKENPTYRGAFEGSQKSEFNKNPDTMDAAERKVLGYTDENDGPNYSYYGPMGTGPQNKVTNASDEQKKKLREKYPLIFQEGTSQNKAFVADFNTANPGFDKLDNTAKSSAIPGYLSKMEDNPAYAEDLPLDKKPKSQPMLPPAGPSDLQPD